MDTTESATFWSSAETPGLDLLTATFTEQVFPRHTHDHFVIGINLDGVQGFERTGAEHVAPAGSIVVINPDDVHTGYAATRSPWVYRCFYPSTVALAEIACDRRSMYFGDAVINDPEMFATLRAAHLSVERSADALARSSAVIVALRAFCRRYASPRIPDAKIPSAAGRMDRVRTMLLDRLDENVTLEELAQSAGMSPFHLLRSFEQRYGLPPHLYRIQQRIGLARTRLSAGLAIADIAASTGFTDQSHLTRWFKRFVGTTPAAYRAGLGARNRVQDSTC